MTASSSRRTDDQEREGGLRPDSDDRRGYSAEKTSFGPESKRWIDTLPEAAFHGDEPVVSPPVRRPADVYPTLEGLDSYLFEIPATGLTREQHAEALKKMRQYHETQRSRFLGYQANQEPFPHLDGLAPYLQCQLNNLGDPFKDGNFTLNSKWLERSVLDYYACLWNARWPHDRDDPESYWGYVLSMGSTEGNLYGLWNAREYLSGGALMEDPDAEEEARRGSMDGVPRKVKRRLVYTRPARPADNPNTFTPVIFFSEDTHYSIQKAVRALRIKTFSDLGNQLYSWENPLKPGKPWPKEVPSNGRGGGPGSIDIDALVKLVEFFAKKGYPILVFFNYGTTFKGAYDDVEAAGERLMPIFEKYGLLEREVVPEPHGRARPEVRNGFWFHVDGALGAAYMPFLEMAHNAGRIPHRGPNFDFRLPYVHSIVMSGHKWIGAPWPCGIFMTRTRLQMQPPHIPEYVGTPDTTFAGSRNGFSALLLWNYAAGHPYEAQIERALATEDMAVYAYDQLRLLEDRLGRDLWVARTSPCSLTIRFKAANPKVTHDFSLSGDTLYVGGVKRSYSHIFIMPHVKKEMIDALIEVLAQEGGIPEQKVAPRRELPVTSEDVQARFAEILHRLTEVLGEGVWVDRETSSLHLRSVPPELVARFDLVRETLFIGGHRQRFFRFDDLDGGDFAVLEDLLHELEEQGAGPEEEDEPDLEETPEERQRRSYLYIAHVGRGFK